MLDSALTTELPTPCRPPETAYPLPPNLPPACRIVSTTSTVDFFSIGWMSTGMPRPLSTKRTPPSAQDRHLDVVAVAGERLVDGVVDDLVDQVVQSARTGRADVHAGPLANRFESLENLDVCRRRTSRSEAEREEGEVMKCGLLPSSIRGLTEPERTPPFYLSGTLKTAKSAVWGDFVAPPT